MKAIFAVAILVGSSALLPTSGKTAANPTSIRLACEGAGAASARALAAREKLPLGKEAKACLAVTSMYGGASKQLVVAVPRPACAPRKAIQVYERSRSGAWGPLFEKPVCGNDVAFGPQNPWGGIMITVDGKHYDQRGSFYTAVSY